MPTGLLFHWKASYLEIFEGVVVTVTVTLLRDQNLAIIFMGTEITVYT
jgi:hypothetical protein